MTQRKELRQSIEDSVLTHTGRSIGDIASTKVVDDIEPLLKQAELRARIDEWTRMGKLYPSAPYIPNFIWKERLAELEQQLKEVSDDE